LLAALVAAAVLGRLGTEPPSRPQRAPLAEATPHRTPAPTPVPTEAPTARPVAAASASTSAAPASPPAAAASAPAGGARLAIIVDDCGQWPAIERGFVALPIPLTLSVLPHVRYGAAIARAAADAGKGVMLHLPMETASGRYPGPGEITTAMSDAAIAAELRGDLADVPLARGVNNHEGSRATADARVMTDVAGVLADDGVYFIDSRTTAASVAETVMREHAVPTARRNVFLDNVDDEAAVAAALRQAAAYAHANGSAIAIGHPRAATLAAVRQLAPVLQADGITFVLAGELAR
jgi:polysaccharide deacetylase 2 family uncharacterized protein YibQ